MCVRTARALSVLEWRALGSRLSATMLILDGGLSQLLVARPVVPISVAGPLGCSQISACHLYNLPGRCFVAVHEVFLIALFGSSTLLRESALGGKSGSPLFARSGLLLGWSWLRHCNMKRSPYPKSGHSCPVGRFGRCPLWEHIRTYPFAIDAIAQLQFQSCMLPVSQTLKNSRGWR